MSTRSQTRRTAAFTLVEAMVAMTILAMTGSVLLLSTQTTLESSQDAMERTIAHGLAKQMLHEAMGMKYTEFTDTPLQAELKADTTGGMWEFWTPVSRMPFDDIDDYNFEGTGFSEQPISDRLGIAIGSELNYWNAQRYSEYRLPSDYFADWKREVHVYYVEKVSGSWQRTSHSNGVYPSAEQTHFREVEVTVAREQQDGSWKELAKISQVHAYVPIP